MCMERNDLVELGLETIRHFKMKAPEDAAKYIFRTTSGTSGDAAIAMITMYAPEAPADMAWPGGLNRVLTCSGLLSARLANTIIVRASAHPMRVLQLDQLDITDTLSQLLDDYKPQIIYGFPSYIARVASYIPGTYVRVLKFVGEVLTKTHESFFKEHFPRAGQTEFYMANEVAGYIATRTCQHLPRSSFHIATSVNVEIEHPDETGAGRLLVSKQLLPGFHVTKYDIGDIGRWAGECTCGKRTLELVGRSGLDYIKIAGALLRREEFDRVIGRLRDIVCDYRAEARLVQAAPLRGHITLRLYVKNAPTVALQEEIRRDVEKSLYVTQNKRLVDLVSSGSFDPLEVTYETRSFAKTNKDIKLFLKE